MKILALPLFIFAMIFGCDGSESPFDIFQGNYEGTFTRTSPTAFYPPADVTLTLRDGKFTGESNSPKYPAICKGTYRIDGDVIEFTNECVWTADFDWTLILNGKFTLSEQGDQIVMRKQMGDVSDTYILKTSSGTNN